jgi:hypothetical protein
MVSPVLTLPTSIKVKVAEACQRPGGGLAQRPEKDQAHDIAALIAFKATVS